MWTPGDHTASSIMLIICFVIVAQAVAGLSQISLQGGGGGGSPDVHLPTEESVGRRAAAEGRRLCVVKPAGSDSVDDAPAIMSAFSLCGKRGLIFLPGPQYSIRSNMTTAGLDDVSVVQLGRMLWSTNIAYWTSVSMPVGFQNQSTVWYFGGNNVSWDGHGVGTLDGNGQVWYDWAKSQGNVARRPMQINFRNLTNSRIRRMRFVQSQMWTMAITYSQNVDLDDIYVKSTSNSRWSTLNTDGCDTIFSDRITFRRWYVENGDDAIALKRNSTNIAVHDSVFVGGAGIAIGSLSQYKDEVDVVENFVARNITVRDSEHVSYLKTWGGRSMGYPPNGGGGGRGFGRNIVIEDVQFSGIRQRPIFLWQCENYSGHLGEDCQTSKFHFSQLRWRNVVGTVRPSVKEGIWFQCSRAAGGCDDIAISNVRVTNTDGGEVGTVHCENVHDLRGARCS